MKRIVTSIILLALSVSVCIIGQRLTYHYTAQISDTMEQIDTALSKGESAKALILSEELVAGWEGMHQNLCLFLQHEHLDPLENIFAVLPLYIEQGNYDLARTECKIVKDVSEHIQKTERIAIANIL